MKIRIFTSLFALLIFINTSRLSAQENGEWLNYTSGKQINVVKPDGDYIWAGTYGGLVKLNRTTGNAEFFNKSNSPLPVYATTTPNAVFDIEIDKDGNKWIGTYGGLIKYDETNWEVYTRFNSGLPQGYVFDIAIDQIGNIWSATYGGGLAVFDGSDWFVYDKENSGIPVNHLFSMAIDNNGNKWIGGVGIDTTNGLIKFNGSEWTVFNYLNSDFPGYESIRDIKLDEDGAIWCATSKGLVIFDGSNWIIYSDTNSGLPSIYVNCFDFDEEGNAWIGTNSGLSKFDGINWSTYTKDNSDIPSDVINDICIDDDGNKWIGTNEGLAKFDGQTFTRYETSNSGLPDNFVHSILLSKSGKKWFGTHSGLIGFDGQNWINLAASFPELKEYVSSVKEDSENNIWMTFYYYDGIAKYDGNSVLIYNDDNSPLPSDNFLSLAIDSNNKVWIGTQDEGLFKFDGINWFNYNSENSGLPQNQVNAIEIDSLGNKWIATHGGLAKFSGSEWIVFNDQNSGLPRNNITALTLDPINGIWTGDNQGNITYFNGLNWDTRSFQDSGFYSDIRTIFIDDDDYKWIGFEYNGIIKFKNNEYIVFNTNNSGLPIDRINVITEDESGNILIGTSDGGLAIYKEGSITAVENKRNPLPDGFQLFQNYPNPFNPSTTIKYSIPPLLNSNFASTTSVQLKIYDILGKEITTLVNEEKPAGTYKVKWDVKNLAGGVYFYRIIIGNYTAVKKMIYLK